MRPSTKGILGRLLPFVTDSNRPILLKKSDFQLA